MILVRCLLWAEVHVATVTIALVIINTAAIAVEATGTRGRRDTCKRTVMLPAAMHSVCFAIRLHLTIRALRPTGSVEAHRRWAQVKRMWAGGAVVVVDGFACWCTPARSKRGRHALETIRIVREVRLRALLVEPPTLSWRRASMARDVWQMHAALPHSEVHILREHRWR